jgi:sigma-B regulation protein RsbU (phosphoserine phosphatase)
MKILIADDDNVSRLLLEEVLKNQGHEVTATVDGRDSWAAFQKEYFPVVISDWLMPELDGLTLCRSIRHIHRDSYSYVILLTTLHGKANYLEAMEAGADDFLTKPFDADQLVARLHVAERILGLRQHVRRLEGLLPICSYCKKIRDDQNRWQVIEGYIAKRTEARFSHSICPECYEKMVST